MEMWEKGKPCSIAYQKHHRLLPASRFCEGTWRHGQITASGFLIVYFRLGNGNQKIFDKKNATPFRRMTWRM